MKEKCRKFHSISHNSQLKQTDAAFNGHQIKACKQQRQYFDIYMLLVSFLRAGVNLTQWD